MMATQKVPPHAEPRTLDPVLLNAVGDPASHYLSAKFTQLVKLIEIEVFSYCNRRCWFCPNSLYPRDGENNLMPQAVYERLIDELAEIGYRNSITYSRYNEPLAKPEIFLERVAYARSKLKDAYLYTHTNSDYLSREYLYALKYAGLNALRAQIYFKNEERYSEDRVDELTERIARQIKITPELIASQPGQLRAYRIPFEGMDIDLYASNFEITGTDRGQTVPTRSIARVSPCMMPFGSMYIDYNGCVMPCCDVRSDIPDHGDYVMGSVMTQSLREIFFGQKLQDFRLAMGTFGEKKSACATCTRDILEDTPILRQQIDTFYQTALAPAPELATLQGFLREEGLFQSTVDAQGNIQLRRVSKQ